jgi:uncharacterized FlgJ-related protein
MILDKITIALNVVIAACAFSTGWTLARYIDAVQAEKVAAIALQDKLERDKVVIKQQADLIAYQDREAEIKRQAEVEHENAITAINTVMDSSRVQIVPISRLCTSAVSESGTPASSVSSASTVFDLYDASVEQLRHDTLEAVRACEIDRESVIRQAGGR